MSVLAVICLGSCAAPEPSGAGGLTGDWELVAGAVDGIELNLVDGFPVSLYFDGEAVGGTAACNGYFGTHTAAEGSITFSGLGSTAMACSPTEIMDLEAAYLDGLSRVSTFTLEEGLALSGEGVDLTFDRLPPVPTADLTDTVWVLEGLIQGDAVSSVTGERATLELFTDGSLLGSTGCRTLSGHYVVQGAGVQFTDFSASGDCEADLQAQDGHVVTVLGDGFRVEIGDRTLTIASAGNHGLVYRAEG